jgi:hypothetical protein
MYVEKVGYLGYKFYSLGWQNALHSNLNLIQHLLLSIFFYYRTGFIAASEWAKINSLQNNHITKYKYSK